MTPDQIEKLKAKLRTQIGDDVGHVYLPETLYEDALKAITAQAEEIERLRRVISDATDPEFIWGALDNVHDMDTTLEDYASAVVRAISFSAALNGETP